MTTSNILFIGMVVHKYNIEIAIADGTIHEVRRYGRSFYQGNFIKFGFSV